MIRCMLTITLTMLTTGCAGRALPQQVEPPTPGPAPLAEVTAPHFGLLAAAPKPDPGKGQVIDQGKLEILFTAGYLKWEVRQDGADYGFWAKNQTHMALTTDFGIKLTNMVAGDFPMTQVLPLPADAQGWTKLGTWKANPGAVSPRWKWWLRYQPGVPNVAIDGAYAYALPWPAGTTGRVAQGWNSGGNNGAGQYRVDVELPFGTPILSSREGRVVAIWDTKAKAKYVPNDKSPEAGGWVFVRHDDGTLAHYHNLNPKKIGVSVGQVVKRGFQLGAAGGASTAKLTRITFGLPGALTGSTFRTYPFAWRVGPGTNQVAEPKQGARYLAYEFQAKR